MSRFRLAPTDAELLRLESQAQEAEFRLARLVDEREAALDQGRPGGPSPEEIARARATVEAAWSMVAAARRHAVVGRGRRASR